MYPLQSAALVLFLTTTVGLAAPPNRVVVKVDDHRRVFLNGHVHPRALAQYDHGPVSPSLELSHLTLMFRPSAAQQAELDQLLTDQQNPSSAQYHHWLTPEEYGARFGVSDTDMTQATEWLESHGFTITGSARARNYITFDGSAANVESAFQTELHNYMVDGEMHFANATEPSIPAALEPVIRGIRGLNDFRLKPRLDAREVGPAELAPKDTSASGRHYIAPDDFAIIYNLKPLYAAGYDGTGQKLVIIGQTALRMSDLQQFRAQYNLPGQDPQVIAVPNTRAPGIRSADLQEANLDLQWAGAVARNATVIYVYAPSVDQSVRYAIDQNLAPVLSMSYGGCEALSIASDAAAYRTLAQQASSQGITWFNASGDSGGADCSSQTSSDGRLSVDLPASVPEITAIGGTEFAEADGTYWNATNDSNSASVLSYIPEVAWNDSAIEGSPAATGGGASIYFSKPAWQTGAGVPSDGARDVPDVSLNASARHDGYNSISNGTLYSVGGTSAPTPMFAGIAAILNQYLLQNGYVTTPGLGNINPKLYSLAQSAPNAFHDITAGDNIVTATCPARGCTTQPKPVGYTTGAGYDQVTGLGSVDIYNLFQAWTGKTPSTRLMPQIAVSASSTALSAGQNTLITVTVSSSNGTTPTGSVEFLLGNTPLGSATLAGSGGTAAATFTVSASQLPAGTNNITAQYTSDNGTFSGAAASVTVTVAQDSVGLAISGVSDGASFRHSYAPGEVLSIFGSQFTAASQTAGSVPLPASLGGVLVTINGVTAPLYLVSPGQLNVQVPYETAIGPANLVVQSNGQSASYTFNVSATAPAIFTDENGAPVPDGSARSGDVVTLFITGAGLVSPSVATGAAPAAGTPLADLPKPPPNVPVTVTVGGINAPVQFAGITTGLVGIMQINYEVPAGLAAGVQPVVVTVGGATSADASLTIL